MDKVEEMWKEISIDEWSKNILMLNVAYLLVPLEFISRLKYLPTQQMLPRMVRILLPYLLGSPLN